MARTPPPASRASIEQLHRGGMSYAAIGRAIGRDPKLVREVAAGRKPGSNLAPSLDRLARTGRVGEAPPRRTAKSGAPVPVRAPRGAGVKSAPPKVTAPAPAPKRGTFGVTDRQHTRGGGFVQTVTAPKTEGAGRESARAAILDILAGVPGSASVSFTWTDSEGFTGTVGARGGYRSRAARDGMRGEGNDPFAWLVDQAEQTKSPPLGPIVRVTIQILD